MEWGEMMIVKYLDMDDGEEVNVEDRENITELLAILNSRGKINLRWPNADSYWLGKFVEAILDVEIDEEGNSKEELLLYFDHILSE